MFSQTTPFNSVVSVDETISTQDTVAILVLSARTKVESQSAVAYLALTIFWLLNRGGQKGLIIPIPTPSSRTSGFDILTLKIPRGTLKNTVFYR